MTLDLLIENLIQIREQQGNSLKVVLIDPDELKISQIKKVSCSRETDSLEIEHSESVYHDMRY